MDIPVDPDAPTAKSVFVHHQLAANRCLVAVMQACRQSPGTTSASGHRTSTVVCGTCRRVRSSGGASIPTSSSCCRWMIASTGPSWRSTADSAPQALCRQDPPLRPFLALQDLAVRLPVFPGAAVGEPVSDAATAIAELAEGCHRPVRSARLRAPTGRAVRRGDLGDGAGGRSIWEHLAAGLRSPRRPPRVVRRRTIGADSPTHRRLRWRLRRFHVWQVRGLPAGAYRTHLTRVGSMSHLAGLCC